MDNNDLTEQDFEAYIEHWLTTEGGYVKGNQATYDKERAIDRKTTDVDRLVVELTYQAKYRRTRQTLWEGSLALTQNC